MSRTRLRPRLRFAAPATLLLLVATASAGSAPNLRGHYAYSGTYERGGRSESFAFEVEHQTGRKLAQVTVDAMNESQLIGSGMISRTT